MAFNPFDIFRRNTRILFAILTSIMMFVFVLQFGQGDVFSLIPKFLASRARTGEVLAVVDGTKVHSSQLGDIETRRLLANEYMVRGSDRALENLRSAVFDNLKTATAQNKQTIEAALQAMQGNFVSQELRQKAQFAQMGFGAPLTQDDIETDRNRTIEFTNYSLNQIVNGKNPPEADRAAAQALLQFMDLSERRAMASGRGRAMFFGNQPMTTTRDNLEFLLWLKKADQLGIQYTTEDVAALANHELFGKMTNEDWRAVDAGMRDKVRFTPSAVTAALADEFRVRSAQAAVMGQAALNPLAPGYDAPAEYYDYFRQETNPATYRVIAVPAENFLDRVAGSPDEATRRELFQAGKNDDPNPRTPKLGLREPRKLKLGWLEVTGEEPYFKAAAAEARPKLDVAAKLAGFLVAPMPGVGLSTLWTAAAPAVTPDLLTNELYKSYAADHKLKLGQSWFNLFGAPAVPDPAFARPAGVATLAAGLAGALAGQGGALAAPAAYLGTAILADRKTRFDTLPPAVIVPLSPGLGGLVTALGNLAVQNVAAQPLPRAAVQGRLLAQFEEKLIKTIASADVVKLSQDLDKLKAGPDNAEAKKLIADFAAARGLKTGASKEFRDQYTMGLDDGLKPLVAKKEEANPFHAAAAVTPSQFGRRFFFDRTPPGRDGTPPREVPSAGFFKPQPYPNRDVPTFLAWRTEEQTPEPLRDPNSAEAKAKVEAAWRRKQARELARKAAEDLAAKAGRLGTNPLEIEPKLTQLHTDFAKSFASPEAQARVKIFTIDDVAPLVETAGSGLMPQRGAGRYLMTAGENIPYPTQPLVEEIVKSKDKPLGTAVVLTDEPGDTVYVAVLANRREKSIDDFYIYVYGSLARGTPLQPIVSRSHRADLQKQARDTAVALLKSEFGYEKESESVNKKSVDE